ncbi:hypothetical protein EMIHUDRAFT_241133 [Emiliania huxleyi CCMP1516]|uniref:Uncharacterized protein n=2 Tax=Emiliania huxleyi TaxID=2903 RepID=A0A0D3JD75_EMIH1|nr:hypothetical protein EMIHUDRAFT_241133 [Emiliania huxleyi CCMP1516]EOD21460.1 hypothetical protein EMIHUDRAFT_241133 [Emiliania huxleyi CCMP1516]|eukprot:XP_005773889.1 hypothetical protein EMIHUDRAFT_241133 [Emiliania huxleyi CCMP1516]
MMLLLLTVTGFSSLRLSSSTPVTHVARYAASPRSVTMQHGGKGFGGGEATRDPPPTVYDPSDPKGKQQAIHKAESFAEYLAKRGGFSDSHKSGVCEPRSAAVSKVAPATAPASGSPYAELADAYFADIRGPSIAFRPGRVDWEGEHELLAGGWCNPMPRGGHGRLPGAEKPSGWQKLCGHIRDEVFYRMGFGDREIVALLCGGHAMLAREFGAAFKKLTELGCEGVLQPEVAAGGLAAAR